VIIAEIQTHPDWTLSVVSAEGCVGEFDVSPYLNCEAFTPLRDINAFMKVRNGKYFIKWECGADLSADTIEAHWQVVSEAAV